MMVPSQRAGMLGLWELLLVTACVRAGVMESQLQQQLWLWQEALWESGGAR